jgi:MFS family permease
MTLRASTNLFLLLILFPAISTIIRKHNVSAFTKDLRLSQASGAFLVLGTFLMFIAAVPTIMIIGVVVFALGSAFLLTARSLVTSLIGVNNIAGLYSAIAIVCSIGQLIAGPLLAATFKAGVHAGGNWIGLPFLVASILYLVALTLLSCVRRPLNQRLDAGFSGL